MAAVIILRAVHGQFRNTAATASAEVDKQSVELVYGLKPEGDKLSVESVHGLKPRRLLRRKSRLGVLGM